MLVLLFACEAAGASSIRHSLRPLSSWGGWFQAQLGRDRAAGMRTRIPPPSCPASSGASSNPRLLGSITVVSGILDRPVKPGDDIGSSLLFEHRCLCCA